MSPKSAFAAACLSLVNVALSTPTQLMTPSIAAQQVASMPPQELATFIHSVDRSMLAAFECLGQSCVVADTAGSTGRDPTLMAEGANAADIKCISSFNPVVQQILDKYNGSPPKVEKQNTGASTVLMTSLNTGHSPRVTVTGKFTGKCTPNILIFAKGTLEPGALGILVGNSFAAGLPKEWSTHGVAYDADIPGDFCLGLPGGMVAKDIINQASKKCPESKLFLGGYSQGAMVVRNGLARADESARKQVKGVITFGDPFNGAGIKGYNGPIAIYCTKGDGVCTGNFEVAASHLAYGSSSAKAAQKKLLEMAAGGGDSKCCHPPEPPPPPTPEEWAATLAGKGGKSLSGKGTPKASKGTPKGEAKGAPKEAGDSGTPKGEAKSAPKEAGDSGTAKEILTEAPPSDNGAATEKTPSGDSPSDNGAAKETGDSPSGKGTPKAAGKGKGTPKTSKGKGKSSG